MAATPPTNTETNRARPSHAAQRLRRSLLTRSATAPIGEVSHPLDPGRTRLAPCPYGCWPPHTSRRCRAWRGGERHGRESSSEVEKRHRVAPPGATVSRAVAVRAVIRYTNHGGGPADGALKGAVSAVPDSSTSAGHPPAAQRSAMAATVAGSVTFSATPSTIRSN